MKAYEIIHLVLEKFKGLPKNLSEITEKSDAWWRSHGREPKTENPIANGNVSAVTHYIRFCKLYEAADKGAGAYLNELVHAQLKCDFADFDNCSLRDLRHTVLSEATDVLKVLDEKELSEANKDDLKRWIQEAIELKLAADNAIDQLTTVLEKRDIKLQVFQGIATNGVGV